MEKTRKSRCFIGQAVKVSRNKPKATKENSGFVYHFSEIRDFSYFSFDQIVRELDEPKPYGWHGLLSLHVHKHHLNELQ